MSLIIDVVLNARTAFWDHDNGVQICKTGPMLKQYIVHRIGWMDIISSFPFQTLKLDENPSVSGNVKTLQMLRLCQVVRIAKVVRAVKALQAIFFKLVNDTFGSLSVSVSVYTMVSTQAICLLWVFLREIACDYSG